jgi:ABC-2 type transport system ATP-binding protein
VNLEVHEGSIYALVGANGAGKTTTMQILVNLLQPSSGRCLVLGADSRELRSEDFTRIGYVSEAQTLPGWMTVDYFLSYLRPFYPTWNDARTSHLLRQLGIPTTRKLRQLSRGMWMKTLLVSSLAYEPRVLILDEPFGGLDAVARDDIVQGLMENVENTTVLIASHDLSEIETFASHIGYLGYGRVQFSEEMSSLTGRFREIEVIVTPPARLPVPEDWPSSWIRPEVANAVVRFVDSAFDEERTIERIRRIFGAVQHVSVNPMSLRSIFITITRGTEKLL